jgi:paraquat-inducible protein B
MTPRPNATRIGLFAIGGLLLLGAAIVAIFGTGLFSDKERAVLHFRGSVYGLQVGSPVVFRGVRLGGVRSVGVVYEQGNFSVPVVVELDQAQIRTVAASGPGAAAGAAPTEAVLSLSTLIEKGLTAQLATHSLLTGQLYVDLDLRPGGSPPRRSAEGLLEIPTTPTRFQSLQDQLDKVDLNRMATDLGATLSAARALVAGPEVKQTLSDLAQASAALSRLATSLDQRVGPLAQATQSTLAKAGEASTRVGAAADRAADRVGDSVAGAASRLGQAADRADALLTPGSPVLSSVQKAADELARSATALREATSEEGATVQTVQRAAGDVSRAARALRELAEQLEQQPQSLIRGRAAAP